MRKYIYLTIMALAGILLESCDESKNLLEGADHQIEITGESVFEVGHEGGIFETKIDANCQWTVSKTDINGEAIIWIKTDMASGKGAGTMRIKVLPNNSAEERSGIVNVYSNQISAYIDVRQSGNPDPDAGKKPEQDVFNGYFMPVYQMFESSLGIDVAGGSVVETECAFTNADVEGNVVRFADGLLIEKTGDTPADIMMACPSHKNPATYAGFQLGLSAKFSSGDSWIFKVPMSYEVFGDLRFTYGSRNEDISDASAYKWSSDEGQTWNDVTGMESVKSEAAFKSVWFTIPEEQKVPMKGWLWIKVTPNAEKVFLQNGITLDYAAAKMSSLAPEDNASVLISEGFDNTVTANSAYLGVPGFMKSATTGYTSEGIDTDAYVSANKSISYTHCFARPGFLQVGYNDESQIKRCGWNGRIELKVGERLKELGRTGQSTVVVKFSAASLTNAFGVVSDAKIVIKSAEEVVGTVEGLLPDRFSPYEFYISGADQNTVLTITSQKCEGKMDEGQAASTYESADYRFFIDDLTVNVPDEGSKGLTLNFDLSDPSKMSGWPDTITPSTDPAARFTCPYVLDGTTYNFISSQPLEVTSTQWPYFNAEEKAVVIPKQRYLGLPVVQGLKLTQVSFMVNATSASYMVASEVGVTTSTPAVVSGGEAQSDAEATEFTFTLSGTQPGAQYWIKVANKAPRMKSMTLTYSM